MLPQVLNSCPRSNKSPNLVTLLSLSLHLLALTVYLIFLPVISCLWVCLLVPVWVEIVFSSLTFCVFSLNESQSFRYLLFLLASLKLLASQVKVFVYSLCICILASDNHNISDSRAQLSVCVFFIIYYVCFHSVYVSFYLCILLCPSR